MMKRILSMIMLFACAVAFCAAPVAKKQATDAPKKLKERFPRSNVRGKNKVFMFNGRRPWVANEAAGPLERAGIRVFLLDGTYLAGLSGAPIRSHMELPEPDPFNGIDKAFDKMAKGGTKECNLVIFNALPPESLTKIFTKERKEKFNKYIANGGNALFTNATPTETLDDLLPLITDSPKDFPAELGTYADLPAGEKFSGFPKRIPVYSFRSGTPAKGVEVLSWIRAEDGEKQAPFICRKKVGKGTITYFNVCIDHARSMSNYNRWLYAQAFTVTLVADCAGFKDIKVEIAKKVMDPIPGVTQLGEVETTVAEPVFETVLADVSVSGNTISFSSGARVEINQSNGSASFFYPGANKPYLKNYAVPGIMISNKQAAGVDTKTWEFTNNVDSGKKLNIKWAISGIKTAGKMAMVTYVDKKGGNELVWTFKAGKFNLDGRVFDGIAHSAKLAKSPLLVSGLYFDGVLDLPSPDFARRFSCYSGPRGYINCYFDKQSPAYKEKRGCDTTIEMKDRANGLCWGYSGSGQPFEYIVYRDGLYMTFLESPTCSVAMRKIDNAVRTTFDVGFGRVHAPVETSFSWHVFAKGGETRGHNDYTAIYQYVRKTWRKFANLDELPPYPYTEFGWDLTADEKQQVIDAAVKYGYRYIMHPTPESQLSSINSEDFLGRDEEIRDAGAFVRRWTSGSYTQNKDELIEEHPEWFLRNERGKITKYGGTYPVLDVNNKEFFNWYTKELFPDAYKSGVRWVYRDMDGSASGGVNYALPESPVSWKSQIKFYRYFHDLGVRVGIEGQNPLVLDEYWYRSQLYQGRFVGNEFALVGSAPGGDVEGGLTLDCFRTGMFCCFPRFNFSGTAFRQDTIPEEVERGTRAAGFVKRFNEVLDNTGMPYIRETEFGTTWIGPKGGALFFWNPTKKATINLPAGWRIEGVSGNVLTDVKKDSIYLLKK